MKAKILITLCFALFFCVEVYAEGEQEVKRGLFPFMAFIYYPDETVVDATGARFLRGAVLIRPDWLVTSAVGPSILTNGPKGFPRKTLLARVGAIAIDANFTLNEDEDEQEREIIQIVRPYNHSATQWWHTDISLMKALLPFNMTSAVYYTTLNFRTEYIEKTCTILVFAKKYGNYTEERALMQVTVEMLPSSVLNCGHNFLKETMACAADSDENKYTVYDPNFCKGNSGGPLICEGEVMGIQTYIDNDCKQPHLYQVLSAWENFITCGTEDKCEEEQCSKLCDVANKDPPSAAISSKSMDEEITTTQNSSSVVEVAASTFDTTTEIDDKPPTPTIIQQYSLTTDQVTSDQTTLEPVTVEQIITEYITAESISSYQTTEHTTVEQITPDQVSSDLNAVDPQSSTEQSPVYLVSASVKDTELKTWPKERKSETQEPEKVLIQLSKHYELGYTSVAWRTVGDRAVKCEYLDHPSKIRCATGPPVTIYPS
ncbi:unnamed protein product [Arctia plantaginis]|uniref:Peptidase S1 domain-containing protein n=1 Tax=Arctia plantaginis TaxID=874455 RepID=A0A8S0ZRP0_ARCPL|nr:unnamed protein product [Arctia plantaginis]